MEPVEIFADNAPVTVSCVALFKVAREKELELPERYLHAFLAGIIDRSNNPHYQEVCAPYVVGSPEDMTRIIDKYRFDPQPNAVPYVVSRCSADFALDWSSQILENTVNEFPLICYKLAQRFSNRLGHRTESLVLESVVGNYDKCLAVLKAYNADVRWNPDFVVTDADFKEFKKEFILEEEKKAEGIFLPISLKKKKSDEFLV
jgi:hypothetical protein